MAPRSFVPLLLVACSPAPLSPTRTPPPPRAVEAPAPRALPTSPPSAAVSRCGALPTGREVIASAKGATTFATDGTHLFWSDGRAIWKQPTSGGAAEPIVVDAVSGSHVTRLLADRGEVWFGANHWNGAQCVGGVGFVSATGGTVQRVGPARCIDGLALTSDRVVFVTQGSAWGGGMVGTVHVAPREKGTKTKVLARGFNGSGEVTADTTHAYFPGEIGELARVPLDGTTAAERIGERSGIDDVFRSQFVVDDSHVYFYFGHLNLRGLSLKKMPKAGGPLTDLAEALPKTPQGSDYPRGGIALGNEHVYWSHPGSGVVRRVKKDGTCAPDTIASGEDGPDWVTIADGSVYWLNRDADPPVVVRMKL